MSGQTFGGERKNGEIHIVVMGQGRDKFARESAATMLQPGEALEPIYASWPKYGYRINVVATPVLFTPEERALAADGLRTAIHNLRRDAGSSFNTAQESVEMTRKASALEALKKRIEAA